MKIHCYVLAALVLVSFASRNAAADILRLDNGDTITGKVVSVDDKQIKITSDVLGTITIERKHVVAIVLGQPAPKRRSAPMLEVPEAKLPKAANKPMSPSEEEGEHETPEEIIERLVPKDFDKETVKELAKGARAHGTPDEAVEQLRREGVDPKLMNELQIRLPGFTDPGVQAMFNDKVSGLMDGSITLSDIRKDAVKARDQLNDLKKDLGPSGEALNGYLGILNGFIDKTKHLEKKPEPNAAPMRTPNPAAGKAPPMTNTRGAAPANKKAPPMTDGSKQ